MSQRPTLESLKQTKIKHSRSVSLWKSLSQGAFLLSYAVPVASIAAHGFTTLLAPQIAATAFSLSVLLHSTALFSARKTLLAEAKTPLTELALQKEQQRQRALKLVKAKIHKQDGFESKADYTPFKQFLSPEIVGQLVYLDDLTLKALPKQAQYQIIEAQATICAHHLIQSTHQPQQLDPLFKGFHGSSPNGEKTEADIQKIKATRNRLAEYELAAPFANLLPHRHEHVAQKYQDALDHYAEKRRKLKDKAADAGFVALSATGLTTASRLALMAKDSFLAPALASGLIGTLAIAFSRANHLQKKQQDLPELSMDIKENWSAEIRQGAQDILKIKRHMEFCGYRPVIQYRQNLLGKIRRLPADKQKMG